MMGAFGFSQSCIDLIMMRVADVNYSVLLNDGEVQPIILRGGLNQSNPLSLHLLILYVEGFSCLFKDAMDRGIVTEGKVCHHGPMISHLLFAGDSFFFFLTLRMPSVEL